MKLQTNAKHWAILGALLVAVGTQLGTAEHGWVDVLSPGFLGGLLLQTGTTIAALFVGSPMKPDWNGVDRRDP